jgi:citrate lyase subunit beta/citryl-CoA lyase
MSNSISGGNGRDVSMDRLLWQSFLFVPGDRPERFDKALASGADVVIIDLEDAVAQSHKVQAREAIRSWLPAKRPVLIRINPVGTAWFEQDCALCCLPGVCGIVLPKTETAADIAAVLARAGHGLALFPLVETAKGMWNALEIAQAPCVDRLVFGTIDLALDLGMDEDTLRLNTFRSQLALVSRVAGIHAPIDGVTTSIADDARIAAETVNGKQLGFGGKLCIHPRQVPTVNACYAASPVELEWAAEVIEAAQGSGGAAVSVNGLMIDQPVILRATRILAQAERARPVKVP